jgi:hypothetical protein
VLCQVEDIRRQAQQDSGRPQPWCHVQFTGGWTRQAQHSMGLCRISGGGVAGLSPGATCSSQVGSMGACLESDNTDVKPA